MLTISTFNIQNDQNSSKYLEIKDYLLKNKIDILSLQEVYPKCAKKLKEELKEYTYTGEYRYLYFPKINESNPIITNKKVLNTKTYRLPHLPSLLNRIITKTVLEIDNNKITVFNTHLSHRREKAKKRELEVILKLLKKESNPIILTGDFNLKNNKELFNNFTSSLEKLGIYRVDIAEKTLKTSKYHRAIDHIFLSKDFCLLDKAVIKELPISDHYPILVKVLYRKDN